MPYDSKSRAYYISGSLANFTTTTNVYTDVGTWAVGHMGTKRMRFAATTNDLTVQILGSFDEGVTYPLTLVSGFAVTTSTPVVQTITDLVTHIKVQVDPTVDDVHGTLATTYVGWSR